MFGEDFRLKKFSSIEPRRWNYYNIQVDDDLIEWVYEYMHFEKQEEALRYREFGEDTIYIDGDGEITTIFDAEKERRILYEEKLWELIEPARQRIEEKRAIIREHLL